MARAKGNGYQTIRTDPFIPLSIKLVTSPLFRSLKPTSIKVLLELLAQYNGRNNGNLCAPRSYLAKWGIGSPVTLNKALKELEQKNLIVKTRQGLFAKTGANCSLYAITWHPIHKCERVNLEIEPTQKAYKSLREIITSYDNTT